MGTIAAPNLVLPLIDLSVGALDTGETVEVVLHGDTYPGDAVSVPEIGTTGYYKIETSTGVAALAQGIYEVYVGGVFKGMYTHGHTALQDHADSVADPHSVAAAQVAITDAGAYYSGSDAEAALQEVGADLAGKADTANTILTDNSGQSVASDKPKVANLDADKVDGKDAGNAADNVLLLDGDGEVPLANIPDTLTGKDADTVDGKDVGNSAGNIPEMATGAVAGKMSTSLLGKEVGTGDDAIPQISTDDPPDAGKVHSTMLGTRNPAMMRDVKHDAVSSQITKPAIQHGFAVFQGDDTSADKTITLAFPSNWDSPPVVLVSVMGYSLSDPTDPEDITLSDTDLVVAAVRSSTVSGATISIQRSANNWLSSRWYAFSWIALGEDTPT